MSKTLPLTGGPVSIEGAVSLEVGEEGVLPWRLPVEQLELFEPSLLQLARCPAGVRLAFVSDTSSVTLEYAPHGTRATPGPVFDLLLDGALHQRVAPADDADRVEFADLPAGEHRLELYLPSQYVPVRLRALRIDAGASARAWTDTRPRWIAYGSSITHCRHAAGPSETWPALVANRCGLRLTCLGYGGNCHMEPMVGRMIGGLPAEYISLKLGINVMVGSLSDRTFRAAVIGLVKTIRDGHPTTPMAVVSPIFQAERESTPNAVGMHLTLMRQRVAEAVDVLRQHGDDHLHYADGLSLFGEGQSAFLADGTHPSAEGYRRLAARYCEQVMPLFGITPP